MNCQQCIMSASKAPAETMLPTKTGLMEILARQVSFEGAEMNVAHKCRSPTLLAQQANVVLFADTQSFNSNSGSLLLQRVLIKSKLACASKGMRCKVEYCKFKHEHYLRVVEPSKVLRERDRNAHWPTRITFGLTDTRDAKTPVPSGTFICAPTGMHKTQGAAKNYGAIRAQTAPLHL